MPDQTTENRVDQFYMRRALTLARRGSGATGANPLVGALVVREGQVVGRGWHRSFGGAHAEIEALAEAGEAARGAVLYVTLEPCDHFGKTPPCSEAVLRSGVRRVVMAMRDPNPLARGGAERMTAAGLEVTWGVLEYQARELNSGWLKLLLEARPEVTLKLACSLDGRIAPAGNVRRWLTGGVSRAQVQRRRAAADAILVGAETVRIDDPELTNRSGRGSQPLRAAVDPLLGTQDEAKILNGPPWESRTTGMRMTALLVHSAQAPVERVERLRERGVCCLTAASCRGELDLQGLFKFFAAQGVKTVFCEGGAKTAASLFRARLVDRLVLYQAPVVLGAGAKSNFCLSEAQISEAGVRFHLTDVRRIGRDVVSEYRVSYQQ